MKQIVLVFVALNCMFFSCEKESEGPVIRGKLVYSSCATDVVEILDPAFYDLGQASWQQSASTPTYSNVFSVKNNCAFRKENIAVGATFSFKLTSKSDNSCAICALWDNPPTKGQQIEIVSK